MILSLVELSKNSNKVSSNEVVSAMNKIGEFKGLYSALNIVYFLGYNPALLTNFTMKLLSDRKRNKD